MPVTEILQSLGSWTIRLAPDTPRSVLDAIDDFGHVTVHSAHQDPRAAGDSLLASARYAGVVRRRRFTDDTREISGPGMGYWLGDEDDKGPAIEEPVIWESAGFQSGVRSLLPGTVTEGAIGTVGGSFPGAFGHQTPRKALTAWCALFATNYGSAEWRVNPDGSLDAGSVEQLYTITPAAIVVREGVGTDLRLRGLPGYGTAESDREDWATRVVVITDSAGTAATAAVAYLPDIAVPFRDLQGNPVRITRFVTLPDGAADATEVGRTELAKTAGAHTTISLDTGDGFDIDGTCRVGDYVHVWDPEAGLVDETNEVTYRGRRINPVAVRLVEATWPVVSGMGVAYRSSRPGETARWTDLTRWVEWEDGAVTQLTVGDPARSLLAGITSTSAAATAAAASSDASVPATMTWTSG